MLLLLGLRAAIYRLLLRLSLSILVPSVRLLLLLGEYFMVIGRLLEGLLELLNCPFFLRYYHFLLLYLLLEFERLG